MTAPKEHTVATGGTINTGCVLWLTEKQAAGRARHLQLDDDAKERGPKDAKLKRYEVASPVFFKPGEKVHIEGDLDRGLEIMFGAAGGKTEKAKASQPAEGGDLAEAKAALASVSAEFNSLTDAMTELRGQLTGFGDALVAAEADLAAAEKAKADLGEEPEAKAAEDADKAIAEAEEALSKVEADIGTFVAGFATPTPEGGDK